MMSCNDRLLNVRRVLPALALIGLCVTAQAQQEQDVVKLIEKIERLENRVAELEAEQASSPNEVLEKRINALTEPSLAADNAYSAFWKNTHNLQTESKDFTLKFGGRIDFDLIWNTQDRDAENAYGQFEDGVNFRRTRLYVEGTVYTNIGYKIQLDFADGTVAFRDVFIAVKDVLGGGTFKAGQYKQPFGLEELTSSKYTTFIERAGPHLFVPSRQSGLMYSNNFAEDDRVYFAVSVYREVDAAGDADGAPEIGDGDYAIMARVTGLPIWDEAEHRLLHIGVGIGFQNPNDEMVRFRQRPETSIGPRVIDTGAFGAQDVIRVNVEAALVLDSFSAQAEYFHVFVNSNTASDPDFWGAYLQLSYFLTGEHRAYSRSSASFDRIKPKSNWHDGGDGSGAWELAVRYAYADLNDEAINGGELGTLTVGVTWHWNPNAKVLLNYTWGNVDDLAALAGTDGDIHTLALRFHIDF